MAGEAITVEGFLAACRETPDAKVRVGEHDGTPQGLARKLRFLLRPDVPTGLFVAGVRYVPAVLQALNSLGLRVPKDLSLILRDSDPFLDYILPPLTRYAIDPVKLARKVSRAVLATANGEPSVRDQRLIPDFIKGETLIHLS